MPDSQDRKQHRMIHVSEWLDRVDALPSGWVLEGLLPKTGTVLVFGKTFSGKTQFLANLTVAIAAGLPFAGLQTIQGPVCWFYLEHQDQDLRDHFLRAARAFGVDLRTLPIHIMDRSHDWDATDADHVAWGASEADRLDAVLVVVDCARAASRLDEDKPQTARIVAGDACKALNGHGKRLSALIHHPPKRGGDDAAGSGYWGGACDHELKIVSNGRAKVTMSTKRHGLWSPPVVFRLSMDTEKVTYSLPDDSESTVTTTPNPNKTPDVTAETLDDRLDAVITKAERISERQIRDLKLAGNTAISARLKAMCASGRIVRAGTDYTKPSETRLYAVPAVPDAG